MHDSSAQRASDLLWACWQSVKRMRSGLPDDIRPLNSSEGYKIQALLEQRSSQPLFGRTGGWDSPTRAARDLDPRQTAQLGEALRTSAIPILVIWGERDTIFPVDTVARPQAEFLRAKLVLVPGGHFTPLDCSREVVQALNAFLPGLPP